ncbi:hypothetical protein F4604DRAFT_1926063 [Suillus subluteus]|nr:hypothetical protein F4604DRAFT_1926063 [Suillus subluteus]
MPATQINKLLDLWASTLTKHNDRPPFANYHDLYKTINNIPVGDVKWQSFSTQYAGEQPDVVQNMLGNPDYTQEFDYCPYCEFSTDGDVHQWKDFMSGNWAWDQAISTTDLIATDPGTHRSTFVPVVLGSDKTMVSVTTGNNEYYPLYASIGNVHNNVRCAHREALAIVGFLTIPKSKYLTNTTPPQLLFELPGMSPSTNTWPPWGSHHPNVKFYGHLLHPPTPHLLSFFLNFLACRHPPTPGLLGDRTTQMSSFMDIFFTHQHHTSSASF